MNEIKRLTNADLAEIKKRADYVIENAEWTSTIVSDLIEDDVPALLAEVKRLRAELTSREDNGVVEETRKLRRELERQRRDKEFDWYVGY